MRIRVKAKPNSRKELITKIEDGYFEARVSVPPEKGRANLRIIEMLSKYFKIPKSKIKIIKGETGKEKLIELES